MWGEREGNERGGRGTSGQQEREGNEGNEQSRAERASERARESECAANIRERRELDYGGGWGRASGAIGVGGQVSE